MASKFKFETTVFIRVSGKERPRAGKKRKNGKPVLFTPPNTKSSEKIIGTNCSLKMNGRSPVEKVPLEVTIIFQYAAPKYKGNSPKKSKPDLDNCIKLVLDAMNGIVYKDDNLVVSLKAKKIWGNEDKIMITVEELDYSFQAVQPVISDSYQSVLKRTVATQPE